MCLIEVVLAYIVGIGSSLAAIYFLLRINGHR